MGSEMCIRDRVGIFVSSSGAIKTKIRRPEKILTESLTVRVGDKISQSTIIEKLTLWEYEPSDPCLSPKTFAKRGGILDLFTEFSGHPLRLEFLGDKISSIRLFSPDTQLSEGLRTKCVLFPPVFSCARNENNLGEILESICPVVLYITSSGVSFLSPKKTIQAPTVTVNPPGQSLAKNKKAIDSALDNETIVPFFYNPTKRPLYRQKEMFPLAFGPTGGFSSSS